MSKRIIIEELLERIASLAKRVDSLERENVKLKAENSMLRKRLSKYENPKNSGNSSIPPSQDVNRPKKNQSLRKPSNKKVGGQPGRKGKTLEITATPDKIVDLHPNYCRKCGLSLEELETTRQQSRQLVDLPPIQAVITEYRAHSKVCSCGCVNRADFPKGVNAPIGYGSGIESLVAYFHSRHFIPFARMEEVFNDVFDVNISEGGLHCLLNRFAKKVDPVYELIKEKIKTSPVVGADETSVKVNGTTNWFWTWQTPNLTYIEHSSNRKAVTINSSFPEGFPKSVLIHDGWKPHINTISRSHQTCIAHLLRHLKYLKQLYPKSSWAERFLNMLYESLELKAEIKDYTQNVHRNRIIQTLGDLLDDPPDKEDEKLYSFFKRMGKERQQIFTFLFMEQVPPDNNASERAIRNVKVKQKISGQFKIQKAAQNFAKIRSVIDTVIKNECNIIEALINIAAF